MSLLLQGVEQAGVRGITIMPKNVKTILYDCLAEANVSTPQSTLQGESQVGHPMHAAWVVQFNEEIYNRQVVTHNMVDTDEEDAEVDNSD